jgi:hypothetical protein
MLDLSQDADRLRFRNNKFPTENPPIIYAPMDGETDKIELSRSSST